MRTELIHVCVGALGLWLAGSNANADEVFASDANGCKVFDPTPQPKESFTWSGGCLDGYADGSGVLQWMDDGKLSTRLEVKLVRGKAEGPGTSVGATGLRFEGSFSDGERSGKGVMTWPNGDQYEGEWLLGKRTGTGVLRRANGDRYEGDFVNGHWSGKGTFTTSAGARYAGDWVNDKREGKGKAIWPDGTRYEGPFVDDKPADPKLLVRESFSTKEDVLGSMIPKPLTTGIDVPLDKNYAQLTPAEQQRVRFLYESMPATDIPPYPLHGPRKIIEAAEKLQSALQVTGDLALAVTVSGKGEPLRVDILRSPDKQMSKVMAEVLLLEKYTPALCKGVPCQMQYPFRVHFLVKYQ
ncbi:MAG TPA: hypothetical protein VGV09_10445 [Steroidobacteraceae bacterium]|nr:hypothetical protein [Steroidobacteraceae bacterium]